MYYAIVLGRNVLLADLRKQKLDQMPGFRVRWHYSGVEVEPWAKYYNDDNTKAFVRNYSNNILSININIIPFYLGHSHLNDN